MSVDSEALGAPSQASVRLEFHFPDVDDGRPHWLIYTGGEWDGWPAGQNRVVTMHYERTPNLPRQVETTVGGGAWAQTGRFVQVLLSDVAVQINASIAFEAGADVAGATNRMVGGPDAMFQRAPQSAPSPDASPASMDGSFQHAGPGFLLFTWGLEFQSPASAFHTPDYRVVYPDGTVYELGDETPGTYTSPAFDAVEAISNGEGPEGPPYYWWGGGARLYHPCQPQGSLTYSITSASPGATIVPYAVSVAGDPHAALGVGSFECAAPVSV